MFHDPFVVTRFSLHLGPESLKSPLLTIISSLTCFSVWTLVMIRSVYGTLTVVSPSSRSVGTPSLRTTTHPQLIHFPIP